MCADWYCKMRSYRIWLTFLASVILVKADFNLTILHTNDVHARVEQTNKYGGKCKDDDVAKNKCFGGVARRKTAIDQIRRRDKNVLLLDGGDQFQGTMWFNVYKGKEARIFMNELRYDAMVFLYYLLFWFLLFLNQKQGRRSNVRARGQKFGGGQLRWLTNNDLNCSLIAKKQWLLEITVKVCTHKLPNELRIEAINRRD